MEALRKALELAHLSKTIHGIGKCALTLKTSLKSPLIVSVWKIYTLTNTSNGSGWHSPCEDNCPLQTGDVMCCRSVG